MTPAALTQHKVVGTVFETDPRCGGKSLNYSQHRSTTQGCHAYTDQAIEFIDRVLEFALKHLQHQILMYLELFT